jgi:hypothetical protein
LLRKLRSPEIKKLSGVKPDRIILIPKKPEKPAEPKEEIKDYSELMNRTF